MNTFRYGAAPRGSATSPVIRMGRGLGFTLALSTMVAGSTLSAQEASSDPVVSADYIAQLDACREIAENAQRLACFDQRVGAMVAATERGEFNIVDREDVRQTRRSLFGFTMPKGGIFGSLDDEDDSSMLESSITEVRRLRGDNYTITIAEGSKWQMSNVPMQLRPPRVGDPVVFKKAALGSYFIRIAGQIGVKGRRIE